MVEGFTIKKPIPDPKPTTYNRTFNLDELEIVLKEYLKRNGVSLPEDAEWSVRLYIPNDRDHWVRATNEKPSVKLYAEKYEY